MKHDYPAQLAACIRDRWNAASAGEPPADVIDPSAAELPDPDSLELLLSVAYQASLLREEERPVTFRMIVAEPTALPAEAGPPSGLHRLLFTRSRQLSSLIAALANVDGAVVLTLRFELLGFGCEIGGDLGDATSVRRALDLEGTRWIEETTEAVGTRHRAAYRLCQRVHEAVAIVISQDGSVRFVAYKDGCVTYWDQLVDLPEA